jgi:hypothetical protein
VPWEHSWHAVLEVRLLNVPIPNPHNKKAHSSYDTYNNTVIEEKKATEREEIKRNTTRARLSHAAEGNISD